MSEDKSFGKRKTDIAEETQIAVMANDVGYIKNDIAEIKQSLKALPGLYLTQKEHSEFVQAVEKRFTLIESQNFFKVYILPLVYVALGAATTFLITFYLQNPK